MVNKALDLRPDHYNYLETKGWGLYKLGKYKEALEVLKRSWELTPVYNHDLYLHLEEAKQALASQNQ